MKFIKIIVIAIIICIGSSFTAKYYYTWASITALQGVSEANLYNACINSPFLQIKSAFPNSHSSLHILTKAQLIASVYIDETNATLSPKTSGQIVVKQDVTGATFSSYFPHSTSTGYGTAASACGSSYTNLSLFTTSNSEPIVTDIIYTDSALTLVFNGGGNFWQLQYGSTSYVLEINTLGVVLSVYGSACTPT